MNDVKAISADVVYRELTQRGELEAYFRLRYQECLRARYHIVQNQDQLNIEPFDFFSRFVGAFVLESGREELIGGVRMVDKEEEGPAAPAIKEICRSSTGLTGMRKDLRIHPFQLMDVLDLGRLLRECEERGERLVEFSRTVVNPEYRRTGAGTVLVKDILTLAANIGADVGFGGCPEHLQHFYEMTGCVAVEKFYHPLHDCRAVLLKIDLASLRSGKKGREKVLAGAA